MKMEEKLYDYMDWAEIEAVVYSEENHPRDILGPRVTEDGVLIQAFFPGATRAAVHTIRDGKQTEMVCEDEAGFFAVLLPGKKIPSYTLLGWRRKPDGALRSIRLSDAVYRAGTETV